MTKLLEKVIAQAIQLPDAEQDSLAKAWLETLAPLERKIDQQSKPHRQAGRAQGLFRVPDDFDEPLEDFREYM